MNLEKIATNSIEVRLGTEVQGYQLTATFGYVGGILMRVSNGEVRIRGETEPEDAGAPGSDQQGTVVALFSAWGDEFQVTFRTADRAERNKVTGMVTDICAEAKGLCFVTTIKN